MSRAPCGTRDRRRASPRSSHSASPRTLRKSKPRSLFRDGVQFGSGLVDLVVGVVRHFGGGHRLAFAGERFVGVVAEESRRCAIAVSSPTYHAAVIGLTGEPGDGRRRARSVRDGRTDPRGRLGHHGPGWCCRSRVGCGPQRMRSRERPAGRRGRPQVVPEPGQVGLVEAVAAVLCDSHTPSQRVTCAVRIGVAEGEAIGRKRVSERIRVASGLGGFDQIGRNGDCLVRRSGEHQRLDRADRVRLWVSRPRASSARIHSTVCRVGRWLDRHCQASLGCHTALRCGYG